MKFTPNGIIGRSGKFYSCKATQHIATILKYNKDKPFVQCKQGSTITFDAYYTSPPRLIPTKKQFETVMDWCLAMEERFEDVIDCWHEPWEKYL